MTLTPWLNRLVTRFTSSLVSLAVQRSAVGRRHRRRGAAIRRSIESLEDRRLLTAAGVSIDAVAHQLLIFDPATGTQQAQVSIPNIDARTDVVLSPDGEFAYVAVFGERQLYVVDVAAGQLANNGQPINMQTSAQDLAITADGRFVLVVSQGADLPVTVVDTTTRQVVHALNEGVRPSAVEVSSNGDVLVTTALARTRRYSLNANGQLTFTSQALSGGGHNLAIHPAGNVAVQTDGWALSSFVIDGMVSFQRYVPGDFIQSLAFSPDGSRLYVRTDRRVIGLEFGNVTGGTGAPLSFGAMFLEIDNLGSAVRTSGIDQIDLSPDGTVLYVSSGDSVLGFDSQTGALLSTITTLGARYTGLDLTPPQGPATLTGTQYLDVNANGRRDADEPAQAGWTVYVDLNGDGSLNSGEPSAVTGLDGSYSFQVTAGTYQVRSLPQPGWIQTGPQVPVSGLNRLFAIRGQVTAPSQIVELSSTGTVLNSFDVPAPLPVRGPQGLALGPSSLFYIDGNGTGTHTLYELDPDTGAIIDADVLPSSLDIAGLAYLNGRIYLDVYPQNQIFEFDPVSDVLTSILNIRGDIIGGLAGAPDLGYLFSTGGNGQIFAIDPQTGAVAYTLEPQIGSIIGGLAYRNGELLASGFSEVPRAYRIDPTTGAVLGSFLLEGTGALSGLAGDGVVGAPGPWTVTVRSSEIKDGLDFGVQSTVGTITGIKFDDRNLNGLQDADEPGLSGWIIYADLDQDGVRGEAEPFTTTDADGSYSLVVTGGELHIREEPQAGWLQTSFGSELLVIGSNGSTLVEVDPASGTATVRAFLSESVLPAFASAFTPDGTLWSIVKAFDSTAAQLAKIDTVTGAVTLVGTPNWSGSPLLAIESAASGGLVGIDFNGNYFQIDMTSGQLTFLGNPGIQAIKDLTFDREGRLWAVSGPELIELNPLNGIVLSRQQIVGTSAAIHGLMVDPLTGTFYASTYESVSQLYELNVVTGEVTAVENGVNIPWIHGGDFVPLTARRSHLVDLGYGQTVHAVDFGSARDVGQVTGVKFHDLNHNGIQDESEPGLAGWTIYADLDHDGNHDDAEPFALTDGTGYYSLVVPSGTFTLREVPQAGWVQTGPASELFASAEGGQWLVSIDPLTGQFRYIGRFGLTGQSALTGTVTPDGAYWTVINSFTSGRAQLAHVDLTTGVAQGIGEPQWTGSPISAIGADRSGVIYAVGSSGQLFTIDQQTGLFTMVGHVGHSALRDLTFDLQGRMWAVRDNLLFQINPQTGYSAAPISVSGIDAQLSGIMVDPATGSLFVTTLSSGGSLYTVDPESGAATLVGVGFQLRNVTGGEFLPWTANRGYRLTVSLGVQRDGFGFGNIPDLGTVTGVKYHDLDRDGVQDDNEPGLAGWIIYADIDEDGTRDVGEPFTTTTDEGHYTLHVASGQYLIREELQPGWEQTGPQAPLYTIGNARDLVRIDPSSGLGTVIGPLATGNPGAFSLAVDPAGRLWTVLYAGTPEASQFASVNPETGKATLVGDPFWTGSPIIALEADADGQILGLNASGWLYSIDTVTGAHTLIGGTGIYGIRDMAFDPMGILWGTNGTQLFRISPLTGAATHATSLTGIDGPVFGLMIDPETGLFYVTTEGSASRLFQVEPQTGVATLVSAGLGPFTTFGGDFTPLTANRGYRVYINPGHEVADVAFGNRQLPPASSPPVISSWDATVQYSENQAPIQIDYNATLTDSDSPDFAGGRLKLEITANGDAGDRLAIRDLSATTGLISLVGDQVFYRGTAFGYWSGGTSGTTPLVVHFGPNASRIAVQTLLQNVTFRSVSDAPSQAPRTIQVTVTDGDGGTSLPVSKVFTIRVVNDAPSVTTPQSTVTYTEPVPQLLAADATVADPDSLDFHQGYLAVKIVTNGSQTDRLTIRHQGMGAGEVGVIGTSVNYGGIEVGRITGGGTTLHVTFNAQADVAAVQAVVRNVLYYSTSGIDLVPDKQVTIQLNDGDVGTSPLRLLTLKTIGVNQLPVIGAFDTDVTYIENAPGAYLDSNATVYDGDQMDFGGGTLTADIMTNGTVDDVLEIRHQGFAVNQIGVSGNQVYVSGQQLGTFTGGTNGNPLQITFNTQARQNTIQLVARNLVYRNLSDGPSTLPRTVRLVLTDGDGGTSEPVTKQITLITGNDAPVISQFSTTVSYTEDDVPVPVSPAALVIDPDSTDLDGGVLNVRATTNSQPTDLLSVVHQGNASGEIGLNGTSVMWGGLEIGTVSGNGSRNLSVTFNSLATPEAVQAVLRNVAFSSSSQSPTTFARNVVVTLSDGDGATSIAQTSTVQVISVNDAPLLTNSGLTQTYVEQRAAVHIAASAGVVDPDSANLSGGVLTVQAASGGTSADWLEIRHTGTGPGQIAVSGITIQYGGIVVATFTGGTAGTPLQVTFNTLATPSIVSRVLQNVTFRVDGAIDANSTRVLRLTLTDGDGGLSNELDVNVNVRNL